jgi:glycosyltransferase involved in cell wall biosynthesis
MIPSSSDGSSADSKKKLVLFAPYPPAKSGIADYVAELMPYHLAEFDVTLVIADDAPVPTDERPRVLLASEYREHRAFFASASKLYHIGNNPHHCYMLDFLGRDPGTVVLHDFNLCYLHEMATLRFGNEARHFAAMESEYGALGRDILGWQLRNEHRELFAGYELPLNGDVLERATSIITHSRQVQYRVAARVPDKPVWYVPHHLSPRAAEYMMLSRQEARRQLGLPQDELVVTAVGFVTRAKHIAMTLAALSAIREQVGRFRFILAGERRPDEYDVDEDIAKSGLSSLVTCTDYLDEDSFFKHLAAADVIVNLRYPSGGEMSGTLVRALGLGIPTIVLDHGPMGELPDDAVRKITWDDDTLASLTRSLHELMTNASARLELGARAAEFVRSNHDIVGSAKTYNRILHDSDAAVAPEPATQRVHFAHPVTVARKLRGLTARRQTARGSHGRTWWAAPGVPLGNHTGEAALIVSASAASETDILTGVFDWKPEVITAVSLEQFLGETLRGPDKVPLPAEHFAFALFVVPADIDEASAALLLKRLNTSMRIAGVVCLETSAEPSEKDDSDLLLGQFQLEQRLRDAGFGAICARLPQDSLVPELVAGEPFDRPVQRTTCVTARKVSNYSVWRFVDKLDGLPHRLGGRINLRTDI